MDVGTSDAVFNCKQLEFEIVKDTLTANSSSWLYSLECLANCITDLQSELLLDFYCEREFELEPTMQICGKKRPGDF